MPTLDPTTRASLQRAMYAYIDRYGGGDSLTQVRAIAGALLSSQEKAGTLVGQGMEMEAWVEDLVRDFDVERVTQWLWNEEEAAIAAQTHHWREMLEAKARATLDAYVQRYAPALDAQQLPELVATLLPVVEDCQISKDEAKRLIQTLSQEFDWQAAMERVIDPKWIRLAEITRHCVSNREVEGNVQEVMSAYIHQFQPSLLEMGTGLIEQAVQAVFNSRVKLDLDVGMDAETQRLLVKQVSLKLKLMEASPPPSKTALEIAQELHTEVARYRAAQGMNTVKTEPKVVRTDQSSGSSLLGGELGVGIEILPSQSPPPAAG